MDINVYIILLLVFFVSTIVAIAPDKKEVKPEPQIIYVKPVTLEEWGRKNCNTTNGVRMCPDYKEPSK